MVCNFYIIYIICVNFIYVEYIYYSYVCIVVYNNIKIENVLVVLVVSTNALFLATILLLNIELQLSISNDILYISIPKESCIVNISYLFNKNLTSFASK